ncbi:MAG: hypothetical protein Q9P01_04820 [Anaerolineae bacterium]|nr:hypothetical protein [Anaerolineae bacterium]
MIATRVFHEMRGYDEYYRYYGVEDRDMSIRLRLMGIKKNGSLTKQLCFISGILSPIMKHEASYPYDMERDANSLSSAYP